MDDNREKQYDVCCVGNWSGFNYGAHLTHYALYTTLKNEGYKVLMLEKPNAEPFPPLSKPALFKENPYTEDALSKIYDSMEDMAELNDICHVFIVGSDQLWNYELFGHSMEFYGLAFVNGDNKKISYATSLGSVPFHMPDHKKSVMRMLLQRFDFVSVREADGVEFCSEVFGTHAEQVLDPVFLCGTESYMELIKKSDYFHDLKWKEPYIFCYIIHPTEEKIEFIRDLSKRKNLQVVCIGDALHADMDFYGLERVMEAKVEDWLALLYHSSCVAADSFHAYSFSLIFEKRIFPIYNSGSFSNRVRSLSEMTGAAKPIYLSRYHNRMNDLLNELEEESISAYHEKLQKEINRSKDWLMKAIEHPGKKARKPESDVLISQLLRLCRYEKTLTMQMDMINSQKRLIEDQNELIRQLNMNVEEYRVELLNKQKEMSVKDKEEIIDLINSMQKQQIKELEIVKSQLNNLKEENDYYKKCIQNISGQE